METSYKMIFTMQRSLSLILLIFICHNKLFANQGALIDNNKYVEQILASKPVYFIPLTHDVKPYKGVNDKNYVFNNVSFQRLKTLSSAYTNNELSAACFNGFSSKITYGREISDKLHGTKVISVEVSFNNFDQKNQKLMILHDGGASYFEVYLNNKILGVAGRSGQDTWQNATIPFVSVNRWHHLVAILDYEKQEIRIHLDGELKIKKQGILWKNKSLVLSSGGNLDCIGTTIENKFSYFGYLKNMAVYNYALDDPKDKSCACDYNQQVSIKKRFELAGGIDFTQKVSNALLAKAVRLKYNNANADFTVNLAAGYGVNPLPIDFDKDGDFDMVFSNLDVPHNGVYLATNNDGNKKMPVFNSPQWLTKRVGVHKVSYINGKESITINNRKVLNFRESLFDKTQAIPGVSLAGLPLDNNIQWVLVDLDGDGDEDIVISGGQDKMERWKLYNNKGEWLGGRMNGYIYFVENIGSQDNPQYKTPVPLSAGGEPINVYGMPTVSFADFDGDGDLDMIAGEFLDKFTYFKNIGTAKNPKFEKGEYILRNNKPLTIEGQMMWTTVVDWDKDGDEDIIVGDENGWIMFVENLGLDSNKVPLFDNPKYFQQKPDELKIGALSTPYSVDWNGDGKEDIIAGDGTGKVYFIENLGSHNNMPIWAKPIILQDPKGDIKIIGGENMSVQGPCEAKWGYTVPVVADWDNDGLLDLILNDITGQIRWYKNIGSKRTPKLDLPKFIEIKKELLSSQKPSWVWWAPQGNQYITQWRTTPYVVDLNKDGLTDLCVLDQEGYLVYHEKYKEGNHYYLKPGKRIFKSAGHPWYDQHSNFARVTDLNADASLRLNYRDLGASGRRKITFVDWDLDGKVDILINSESIDFFKNVSANPNEFQYEYQGKAVEGVYAGHDTCPTIVHWNKDGIPDLLFGAEDGCFYFVSNPYRK